MKLFTYSTYFDNAKYMRQYYYHYNITPLYTEAIISEDRITNKQLTDSDSLANQFLIIMCLHIQI
jgi:hypothetical protein